MSSSHGQRDPREPPASTLSVEVEVGAVEGASDARSTAQGWIAGIAVAGALMLVAVVALGPRLGDLALGGALALALSLSRLGVLGPGVFDLLVRAAGVLFAGLLAVQGLGALHRLGVRWRARRAGEPVAVVRWPMGLVVLSWVGLAAAAALVGSVSPVLAAAVFLAAGLYLALYVPLVALRFGLRMVRRAARWAAVSPLRTGGVVGLALLAAIPVGVRALRAPQAPDDVAPALEWALVPLGAGQPEGLRASLQRAAMLGETVLADGRRWGDPLRKRLAAAQLPLPRRPPEPVVDEPRSALEMAVAVGRIRHDRFEVCADTLRTVGSDVYEGARLWLTRQPDRQGPADDVLFESLLRVCLREADGRLDDPRAVFLEAVANTTEDRRSADDRFPRCESDRMPGTCWRDVGPADLRRPSERALARWAWCRVPEGARRILMMRLRDGRALADAALRTGRDPVDAAALYYQGLDVLRNRWRQSACGDARAAAR